MSTSGTVRDGHDELRGSGGGVLVSREDGELMLVRVEVESRQLEEVLDSLAELPFPVNPELQHIGLKSVVEFPVFESLLGTVGGVLAPFELVAETRRMVDAIRS